MCASATAVLAACSPTVSLQPGPFAPDPVCAAVIQLLPQELGGQPQVSTTAQATVAWGGDHPVTLRCGVDNPPPTTDRCITVEAGGSAVDWINPEADSPLLPPHAAIAGGAWTFITYGRTPAIELVVPAATGIEQPTALLVDLAPAVQRAPATRFCVATTDLLGP